MRRFSEVYRQISTDLNIERLMMVLMAVVILALTASCTSDTSHAPVQPPPLPDAGKGWGTPAFVQMCRDPVRYDAELCGDLR